VLFCVILYCVILFVKNIIRYLGMLFIGPKQPRIVDHLRRPPSFGCVLCACMCSALSGICQLAPVTTAIFRVKVILYLGLRSRSLFAHVCVPESLVSLYSSQWCNFIPGVLRYFCRAPPRTLPFPFLCPPLITLSFPIDSPSPKV